MYPAPWSVWATSIQYRSALIYSVPWTMGHKYPVQFSSYVPSTLNRVGCYKYPVQRSSDVYTAPYKYPTQGSVQLSDTQHLGYMARFNLLLFLTRNSSRIFRPATETSSVSQTSCQFSAQNQEGEIHSEQFLQGLFPQTQHILINKSRNRHSIRNDLHKWC